MHRVVFLFCFKKEPSTSRSRKWGYLTYLLWTLSYAMHIASSNSSPVNVIKILHHALEFSLAIEKVPIWLIPSRCQPRNAWLLFVLLCHQFHLIYAELNILKESTLKLKWYGLGHNDMNMQKTISWANRLRERQFPSSMPRPESRQWPTSGPVLASLWVIWILNYCFFIVL